MERAFCTCAMDWLWTVRRFTDMNKLWRGLARTIFWSYERGSWPYDLMVLAILAFVFVTPRSWFRDQPQSNSFHAPGIELTSQDTDAGTRTYRLDATLLNPQKRASRTSPELERETHDILSRNVDDLKGRTFQVVRITALRGDDGSIQSYDVIVKP
jgi:hypothetical protein